MSDIDDFQLVGRSRDFHLMDEAWAVHSVFGVFGLRSVGKSRFVKEYMQYKGDPVLCTDIRTISDTQSLYANLVASLKVDTRASETSRPKFRIDIIQALNVSSDGQNLNIVFDNAEDIVESKDGGDFLKLCTDIVKKCPNVKVVITSTTRTGFSEIGNTFFPYELKPLFKEDAATLLRLAVPGVNFGENLEKIVEFSEGLPLLILMIGSELSVDGGLIQPEEMVNLLSNARLQTLSGDSYPPEERVADVYKSFVKRLVEVYQELLTQLDYIPGSFNASQAHELLLHTGTEAHTKVQVLRPIRIRSMLTYEKDTERFNIQGILREVIKTEFVIRNMPEIRSRYIKIFSKVMTRLASKIGTAEYAKAMSEFVIEQPNLQKLLTEVSYTTQDTYHFFIEIATKCNQMIETFMPSHSDDFYETCLELANRYMREHDKVDIYLAVGSMYTNTKGEFGTGEDKYRLALKHLERAEKSLQQATVYQRLGWNLHRQGDNAAAIRYYGMSLAISVYSGPDFRGILTQSLSSMGIALNLLGDYANAEKYHKAALEHRKNDLGENHPFVGSTYNNLGLVYQEMNDHEKSLPIFMKSLDIKRKTSAPKVSIIASMSNAANANNALGRFQEAHALLDEAMEIIAKEKVMYTMLDAQALIFNTKGKVHRAEGRLQEACEAFEESVRVSVDILPNGFILMKRMVSLGCMEAELGNYQRCIKTMQRAMKLAKESIRNVPNNEIVVECLECLMHVYEKLEDFNQYRKTVCDLEAECLRLERVCLQKQIMGKLEFVHRVMSDVDERLRAPSSVGRNLS